MLQGLDRLYYRDDAPFEQLAASLPMFLPVHYISVSEWLCRALLALQPGASCRVVQTGISKTVFKARAPSADGPLRVLVEGQPGIWFKGVQDAVAAARAMREPVVVTLAALDRDDPLVAELPIDRVVGGSGPEAMAAAYEETDVLLKLSRFEGLSMPPLEALHCGVPAVVTPFGGHEDYVRHGENGIVVGFDDLPGTTGWLDRLAVDRGLLARLSAGALATAAGWPDEHASTRRLAEVLREIADAAPLDEADALAPLVREVRLRTELGRQRVDDLEMRLDIGWGRAYDLSRRRAVRVALAASRWFGRE
jgi:glycosyltransferase involved in cell wall biosynthesis